MKTLRYGLPVAHRAFKDRVYAQFARVGAALASEKRLELLDLLAQAPRHVEGLAAEADMSVANTSRHLQALKATRLVETDRDGTRVIYRLAGDEVLRLWLALRSVAESRLAEVPSIVSEFAGVGAQHDLLGREALQAVLPGGDVHVVDVRPSLEYEHGHLPGAVSVPVGSIAEAVDSLPRDRRIVVYCRGRYCRFADEAVAILRGAGFDAVRLDGGWPEWLAEGRPVST